MIYRDLKCYEIMFEDFIFFFCVDMLYIVVFFDLVCYVIFVVLEF